MAKKQTQRNERSESMKTSPAGKNETPQWKYLAFACLFAFPAFIYVFEFLTSAFKSHRTISSISGYLYVIFTAVAIVVVWLYIRPSIGARKRYIIVILVPVLLLPSLKVYMCSPVIFDNKDIGTTFKLGSTSEEIHQYCGEYCLKKFSKSLYAFSLISPHVTLKVKPNEVVDLNLTTNSLKGGESLKSSRLFLIFSLRSVRGKVHSLSMVTRVPIRSTKILDALARKQSMELTGKIMNIGSEFKELKANLEKNKLFVRPVVFDPYRIKVNDDDEL